MQYTEKYISLNIQLLSGIFMYEIYKNMKVNSEHVLLQREV